MDLQATKRKWVDGFTLSAAEVDGLLGEVDRLTQLCEEQGREVERAKRESETLYPAKCPITRRDFFMVMEHPELGDVPTYGGPFDSYTIPEMGGEADQPFHERELFQRRFDHDAGSWVECEYIALKVINEEILIEFDSRAEQAESALSQAREEVADLQKQLDTAVMEKNGAKERKTYWKARAEAAEQREKGLREALFRIAVYAGHLVSDTESTKCRMTQIKAICAEVSKED